MHKLNRSIQLKTGFSLNYVFLDGKMENDDFKILNPSQNFLVETQMIY
tara:strand:+ start:390 stop:533 length:144 start_codon:yes stop_codon:yes gene_type:complete